jgi:apolipoprotein D and lipocalin family protein
VKAFKFVLSLCSALVVWSACASGPNPTPAPQFEPVRGFDVQKYLGRWYEIGSFPQRFQKGCHCTTAEYSLREDGKIDVVNTCRLNGVDGRVKKAEGKARFEGSDRSLGALEVSFFLWFYGQYWVVDLADDYSWAAVSNKKGSTLWILARSPSVPQPLLDSILARLESKGLRTNSFQLQTQEGCWK